MHKKIKLLLVLYLFVFLTGGAAIVIKDYKYKSGLKKPNGDSYSVLAASSNFSPTEYYIYGFLPYWTINQSNHIQYDKLTDLAYFALHIEEDGSIRKFQDNGNLDPGYNNWVNNSTLKNVFTNARKNNVRVAVTVISHEDDVTEAFLDCNDCWETLARQLSSEMDRHNIKHVNLDFESAGYTSPIYADKYTQLSDYLNRYMDKKYGNSFVVVSTFADATKKPRITKPKDLSKVVDALFIMAYDFYRPNSETSGPVSPINSVETGDEYDIQTMINDYKAQIPPNKLIMGVPYYGYNWVVRSYEPNSERIPGNDFIGYSQSQIYADIVNLALKYNPTIMWDPSGKVPYFTYISSNTGSIRQVYFENRESLEIKYDLIKTENLGGVGIWALGYDRGYQELWQLLSSEFPR